MTYPWEQVSTEQKLRAEIRVLRNLLYDATRQIDGEWGMDDWDGDLDTQYDIPTLIRRELGAPSL